MFIAPIVHKKNNYHCPECSIRLFHPLPHCTDCDSHHSRKLSCSDAANLRDADRRLGDATP